MDNTEYEIPEHPKFPNIHASFDEKSQKSFGLAVGQAITSQWFYKSITGGVCQYYTNQATFLDNRIYANGQVDMKKYLPKLGTNGDVSLLNLAGKSLTTIPKIVDLIVNGMCDRGYVVEASAIDPVSQNNKQAYRNQIKKEMNTKDFTEAVKSNLDIDISTIPTDKLPETDDELNLHLQMEYKPSCELSAQMAIQSVMDENLFDLTIERQITRDAIVDGLMCIENRFHPAKGITLERIDPIDMVYSFTKDQYFRDCFYKGRVKRALVDDVLLEFPNLRNPENLETFEKIQESGRWWNTYHNLGSNLRGHCHLLYFTYRTTREEYNKIKEKSTGEKILSKADVNFDESKLEASLKKGEKKHFKRISKVEEVLFEGVLVLGTNILLKWELAKSMARPNSNTQKVCEQYVMVAPNFQDGQIFSMVGRMKPIEDERNLIELKARQIIQKITPDGIGIDLDAIAEVDLANGKTLDHNESLNMYLQTGSFFYRSYGAGGDFNNAQKPYTEIKTGDSIGKLQALREQSNQYLMQITDVVGLNNVTDASSPTRDMLVGVQKVAALNSNLATRHILSGKTYVTLETSKSVLYRYQDVLRYYPSIKKDFIRKIGATAVEDLESISNLHLSDFAIYLHLEQDDEEKAILDADLSLAVQQGQLTIADKFKIKSIRIFKLALQYMTIVIEKNTKKSQEQKAQEAQQKSDMDIRTSQQSNQFAQQTIELQNQADEAKQNAIGSWEKEKEQIRINGLLEVEKLKGENAKELQLLVNSGKTAVAEKSEEGKKENLAVQANYTTEHNNQKQNGIPPKDFVAENEYNKMFELNE